MKAGIARGTGSVPLTEGAQVPRRHRKQVPRGGYALTCQVCSEPFQAFRSDARFCSRRCTKQQDRWNRVDWEDDLDARAAAEDAAWNGLGRPDPRPAVPHDLPQALGDGRLVDHAGEVWTPGEDELGHLLRSEGGVVRRPWVAIKSEQQLVAWRRVALMRRAG